jgi:uncharacterized heparinase superfamily protein
MHAMTNNKLKKYYYTVRLLQTRQIVYQLYYRCFKLLPQSFKFLSKKHQNIRPWQQQAWSSPTYTTPRLSPEGELTILDEDVCFEHTQVWQDPNRSKLWLYNLHYFDVLNTAEASAHVALLHTFIERWIHDNPPCQGNGWEPYPLSLRLVNLVKWFSKHPKLIKPTWLISLEMQAHALSKQTEYHILANHVFANAKALVFCGAYLEGPRADFYIQKGLKILDKETDEQFLSDGGHFELSPMYHSILLWDLCDLVNLAHHSGLLSLQNRQLKWRKIIEQALIWLDTMTHPDGNISFFNDAAFNIAPTLSNIKHYAEQLKITPPPKKNMTHKTNPLLLHWLKDSGYIAVNLNPTSKAIMDVANIGPDYQPGHAHADTLSFELTLHGQRLCVNSGTSTYTQSPQRQHERSTKAHNTVNINHEDSSEVWAGFRVARRAYPQSLTVNQQPEYITISCSHDGYSRLPNKNIHTRAWTFSKQEILIHDTITGAFNDAESRLYFHPDVHVVLKQETVHCYLKNNQEVLISFSGSQQLRLEASHWHARFGTSLENYCLIATFSDNNLLTHIQWND